MKKKQQGQYVLCKITILLSTEYSAKESSLSGAKSLFI